MILRLTIVGFGTVGRWLADAVRRRRAWLARECGTEVRIVGVATRHDGFVHHPDGFDVERLLALVASGRPLAQYPGSTRWPTALKGLEASEADVLGECSSTNPREPEPALSHIRLALERRMHVVTSSKGACAAAAVELLARAREQHVEFRMESTVMAGTPVLVTIREGLAGTRVTAVRGGGTPRRTTCWRAWPTASTTTRRCARRRPTATPSPTRATTWRDMARWRRSGSSRRSRSAVSWRSIR